MLIGANKSYFKVGHYAVHQISEKYPEVSIRLANPYVSTKSDCAACSKANIEFVEWDPKRPESLEFAF